MFSRLFQSAQRIIGVRGQKQRNEGVESGPTGTPRKTPRKAPRTPGKTPRKVAKMVTTRGQSARGTPSGTPAGTPLKNDAVETPSSGRVTRKRGRAEMIKDETDSPASRDSSETKRKRTLPVRSKEEPQMERHSHIQVIIPVKDISALEAGVTDTLPEGVEVEKDTDSTPSATKTPAADEQTKEAETVEEEQSDKSAGSPEDQAQAEEKLAPTSVEKKDTATPKQSKRPTKQSTPKSAPKSATPKSPSATKPAPTSSATKTHKKFDEDESIMAAPAPGTEAPKPEIAASDEESEEDSDDDEAPEEVGKTDAQDKVKEAARNAAKAAEEQRAVERKKRKEKEERLRERAKESAAKRQKVAEEEEHGSEAEDEVAEPQSLRGEQNGDSIMTDAPLPPRTKISRSNLPDVLPASFLSDNNSDDDDDDLDLTSRPSLTASKPTKTKFVEPAPKRPKDRKKDGVIYRVADGRVNPVLAPKASVTARHVKETWMAGGGRGPRDPRGGNFKKPNSGFFVKK